MLMLQFSAFGILLLLCLFAVIAFAYLVVKPSQTRWAIRSARRIVNGGSASPWRFENTFRMLAAANNDLEAEYLWRRMLEIREKTPK